MRAYVIEPQALFVPALLEVLERANLTPVDVAARIDISDLVRFRPKLVFVDTDYLLEDPLSTIETIRTVLPETLICIYTSRARKDWLAACHCAGADGMLLKSSSQEQLESALKHLVETGMCTEPDLIEN